MRFVRFGEVGAEKPGVLDAAGGIRDLSSLVDDIRPAELPALVSRVRETGVDVLPLVTDEVRLGVPLTGVSQILAIGLNYASHIEEIGSRQLAEPRVFAKSVHSLCGPFDDVIRPRGSVKLDWEVELVAVIGRRCQYVEVGDALDFVGGYCVGNDVSERDFQLERSGQWVKGKSAETFSPVGPWFVTPDELDLDAGLEVWTELDNERVQSGSTRQMLHGVAALVSHLSQFMVLMPGDLVFTGTPDGVGMARTPPVFMQPGQQLTCGIEGLGIQSHLIVEASDR